MGTAWKSVVRRVLSPSSLSAVAELLGVSGIVLGFALIAPWLGWIVGGLALVVLGQAIDPSPMSVRWPRRKPREGS